MPTASGGNNFSMTANAVVNNIGQLSRAEQSRVIHFALELARERQMSGDQLSELARQMADAANPAEVQRLREEIHRGFYGALACRDAWPPVFSPGGATENSPGQPSIARAALG